MSRSTVAACTAAILLALAVPAFAQNEDVLRRFFEGKRVTVKIDMPGTSEGIDVHADSPRAIDYKRYGDRLKSNGIAIRAGDSVVVTLVKVKKDVIEFQLGGGGFGTFGDDTSTSVYIAHVDKSNREKDLEKRVKEETDGHRKRELQDELDDLRNRRERENRRIDAERARAEEIKKERVAEARLHGGSRFNLRYAPLVPAGVRPDDVMATLAEYVDFSNAGPSPYVDTKPIAAPRPSGDLVVPRKGMSRDDAERAYGKPISSSDRREGSVVITTVVFFSGDQKINAEFIEDILVRYTITSR